MTHLVANMLPTRKTPDPDAKTPGFYEITIDSVDDEPPVTYFVQLPPEYDPAPPLSHDPHAARQRLDGPASKSTGGPAPWIPTGAAWGRPDAMATS